MDWGAVEEGRKAGVSGAWGGRRGRLPSHSGAAEGTWARSPEAGVRAGLESER